MPYSTRIQSDSNKLNLNAAKPPLIGDAGKRRTQRGACKKKKKRRIKRRRKSSLPPGIASRLATAEEDGVGGDMRSAMQRQIDGGGMPLPTSSLPRPQPLLPSHHRRSFSPFGPQPKLCQYHPFSSPRSSSLSLCLSFFFIRIFISSTLCTS